jgi:molecular chaperone IbpA
MRNYDFTPLWRSTVGFDRTFDLLNNSQMLDGQDNYPPYDIARTGEESYRISLAIAGFSPDGGRAQSRAGQPRLYLPRHFRPTV